MELDSNQESSTRTPQSNTMYKDKEIHNNEPTVSRTNERFQTELIMAEMDVLEKEISLKTSEVDSLQKQINNKVKKEKDYKAAANKSFTKAHNLYKMVVVVNKSLKEKIKNLQKSFEIIENKKREILLSLETAEKENVTLQLKLNETEKTYKDKITELNGSIRKFKDEINDKNDTIERLEKKNKNITDANNELIKAKQVLKNDLKELTNLTSEILEGKGRTKTM